MIPPRIDASATKNPLTAKVGDEVKVTVQVQGNPAPKVDWYVGGRIILPGTQRYMVQSSGFVHTLTIRPVSTKDSTIRIVARNPAGDHTYDQQLSFYKVTKSAVATPSGHALCCGGHVFRKYSTDEADFSETNKPPGPETVVRRRKLRLYGGLSMPVLPSFNFLPKRKRSTNAPEKKLVPMKATLDDDELFHDPVPKVTRAQSDRVTRTVTDAQYNSNILRSQSDYRVRSTSLPRRTGSNASSPGDMDTSSLPRKTSSRSSDYERFTPGSRSGSVSQLSVNDVSVSIPSPQPLEMQKAQPERAKIRKSLELIPQYEKVAQKRGLESPKQMPSKPRHHSAMELSDSKESKRYEYGILTEKELETQIETFFSPYEKPSSRVLVAHSFEDVGGAMEEGLQTDSGKDEVFTPSAVEMHSLPEALSDSSHFHSNAQIIKPYSHGNERTVASVMEPENQFENKPTTDRNRNRVTFDQLPHEREAELMSKENVTAQKLAPDLKEKPGERSTIKPVVDNKPASQRLDSAIKPIPEDLSDVKNVQETTFDVSSIQKPAPVATGKNSIEDRLAAISVSQVPKLLASRKKESKDDEVQEPTVDSSDFQTPASVATGKSSIEDRLAAISVSRVPKLLASRKKESKDDEVQEPTVDSSGFQTPASEATEKRSIEDKFAAISVSRVPKLLESMKKESLAQNQVSDFSDPEKQKSNNNQDDNTIKTKDDSAFDKKYAISPNRNRGVYRVEPVEPNNNIWQIKNKETVINGNGNISPTDLNNGTSVLDKMDTLADNEVIISDRKQPVTKSRSPRTYPKSMQKSPLFSEYKEFVEELESFKPEEKEDIHEMTKDRRTSSPAPEEEFDDSFCLNDDPAEVFDKLERAAPPETSPFMEAAAFRPAHRTPPGGQDPQVEGVLEKDVDDLLVNIDSPSRERSVKRKHPIKVTDSDDSESVDSDLDEYARRLEEEEEEMIIHDISPHVHYEHLERSDHYRPTYIIEETIPEEDSDMMEESPEDSTEEVHKEVSDVQEGRWHEPDVLSNVSDAHSGLTNGYKVTESDEPSVKVEIPSKEDSIQSGVKTEGIGGQNGNVDPDDILAVFEKCLQEETSQDLTSRNIPDPASTSAHGDTVSVSHKASEVPTVQVSNEYLQTQPVLPMDQDEGYNMPKTDSLPVDSNGSEVKERSSSGGSTVSDPSLDTCVELLTDIPATNIVQPRQQSRPRPVESGRSVGSGHSTTDKEFASPLRVPPVTDLDESSGADSDLDSYMVYLASKDEDFLSEEADTNLRTLPKGKDASDVASGTENRQKLGISANNKVEVVETDVLLPSSNSSSSLPISRTSSEMNVGYLETDIDAISDEPVAISSSGVAKGESSIGGSAYKSSDSTNNSSQENGSINVDGSRDYKSLYNASSHSDASKAEEPSLRHRKPNSVEHSNGRRREEGSHGNGWAPIPPGGASPLDDSIANEKTYLIASDSWQAVAEVFWSNIWSFLMLLFALLFVHLLNPYFVDKSDTW